MGGVIVDDLAWPESDWQRKFCQPCCVNLGETWRLSISRQDRRYKESLVLLAENKRVASLDRIEIAATLPALTSFYCRSMLCSISSHAHG
jgi:hypothetical protein